MADKKTCNESIVDGYWRARKCGRPAKFLCLIEMTDGENRKFVKGGRCGIHAKRYEKIEEIKNG